LLGDRAEPRFERRIGRLEIRRIAPRVEARTDVDVDDFEAALEIGCQRLLAYVQGGNRGGEEIATGVPVTATHRLGFTVGFAMPAGRKRPSLPAADDDRISLCDARGLRVAVLRLRGRYDADNVGAGESELLRRVADAGLSPVGPIVFAGYDPPTTLPILRRNELWVEIER